jgi:hypothetical protein
VLLAVPDPELYNAQVARALLESTYRRRQGVIGFSKAMVSAGTLGAAYASIEDVVAHLDEVVEALFAGRAIESQYPQYWRVAINDSVARSLDLIVDASARSLGNFPPMKMTSGTRPQSRGFGASLVLAASLPMLITLSVIGFMYFTGDSQIRRDLEQRATLIAAALAEASEYGLISGNSAALDRSVREVLESDRAIASIDILDATKHPYVSLAGR